MEVDPSVQPAPKLLAGSQPREMASPQELGSIALDGLRRYFSTVDPKGFRYLKERYTFRLTKSLENSDGLTLTVSILPVEKYPGREEMVSPDHPLYGYYQQYRGGKTGQKVYKTPKDAIEEIPADPRRAYRGMSWEEWQDIRRKGYIYSRGKYNLGQEDYTLFGQDPPTAVHYAHGFAPLQYQTSFRKPSVVIAIPRDLTRTHQDDPDNIPQSELGVKGRLSSEHITDVWMLVPVKADQHGYLELRYPYVPAWDQRKYKDPMMGFFRLAPELVKAGSGTLSGISQFALRKLV